MGSTKCPACLGVEQDVEHVWFQYPQFVVEQSRKSQAWWKGPLTLEGMGVCLLSSKEDWGEVVTLATGIVDQLGLIRREEKKRRNNVGNN